MKLPISRNLIPIAMMICLSVCTMVQGAQPSFDSTIALQPAAAQAVVGGLDWGCGLLVGAVGAVVAIGVGGATLGFGAAFAASAAIHVGAVACAI
jgi:hypothetical protein